MPDSFRNLTVGDAAYPRLLDGPPSRLFCLAPEGVFRATAIAGRCGGLLPHLFTMTLHNSGGAKEGYLFSVTLSVAMA